MCPGTKSVVGINKQETKIHKHNDAFIFKAWAGTSTKNFVSHLGPPFENAPGICVSVPFYFPDY